MSELGEALKRAHGEHQAVLITPDAGRTVAAVRRRRAWRAGGTVAASVVTIGAVAAGAVAALGPDEQQPAALESMCALDEYPLPHVEALAGAAYYGRAYLDIENGTGVYHRADGDVVDITRDEGSEPSSRYSDVWTEEVWRFADPELPLTAFRMYGSDRYVDVETGTWADYVVVDVTGEGPQVVPDPTDLWWEWTTEVPDEAPVSLNVGLAEALHDSFIFGTYIGIAIGDVDGATRIERLVERTDGEVESQTMLMGYWADPVADTSDVVHVTTRIAIPGEEPYEIVSTRAAAASYDAVCGEDTSVYRAVEPADQEPEYDNPYAADAYLTGPEDLVFRCGVPLDPELEGQLADLRHVEGLVWDEYQSVQRDYGVGATVATLTIPGEIFDQVDLMANAVPGWDGSFANGSSADGPWTGANRYTAPVWVDDEGRIVGTLDASLIDWRGSSVEFYADNTWGSDSVDGPVETDVTLFDDASPIPCGDATEADLAAATPVILYGEGATTATMTWMWFSLDT